MVYHPNEFETAVTLGQNEPLYCNVPDSLSESLARARLNKSALPARLTLRLLGHTPRLRDPSIAKTVVILKPKTDEEIEADNFVRRDYVCKNEFFCFLLNYSILVFMSA